MLRPSRRQLLFAAIGAMSVLATRDFFLLYCRNVSRNVPDFFASLDPQVFAAARDVGLQVARRYPGYGTTQALADHLSERPLLLTAHQDTCLDTRRAMLQQQCCADFAAGHTVVVGGWVMSETEAQLCAAIA